jgi:hypothetical protein
MRRIFFLFLSIGLLLGAVMPGIGLAAENEEEPVLSVKPAKTTIEIKGDEGSNQGNSRLFQQESYHFEVSRDYNQSVTIPIKNNTDEAATFKLITKNVPEEIPIDFIKEGSENKPFVLLPNEEIEVTLGIHAQNTSRNTYEFKIEAIDTSTNKSLGESAVSLDVDFSNIDFTINEEETNPHTLAKKLTITNNGETVTDFQLLADEKLSPYVTFDPVIGNTKLEKGESVDVTVIPSIKDVGEGKNGTLTLTGAGEEKNIEVDFDPGSKEMHKFTLEDLYSEKQQSGITPSWKESKSVEGNLDENGGAIEGKIKEEETDQEFDYSLEVTPTETQLEEPEIEYYNDGEIAYVQAKMTVTGEEYEKLLENMSNGEKKSFATAGENEVKNELYDIATYVSFSPSDIGKVTGSFLVFGDTLQGTSNLINLAYLHENGQVSNDELTGYAALEIVAIGLGTAGVLTGNPFLAMGSMIISDLADSIYKDLIEGKPILGGIFEGRFLNYACINIGTVRHNFSVPNYIDSSNTLGDSYMSTRIHRFVGNDYIAEDFQYTMNGDVIFESFDKVIEGTQSINFPTEYLEWQGENEFVQKNSHKNRGNYIVERNTSVTIPVSGDYEFYLYGDDREDASNGLEDYDGIKQPKPDFAIFPEDIYLKDKKITDGQETTLRIKVHNLGLIGHETEVKIYDNGKLIEETSPYPKITEPATIEIPWVPTEGKHTIKVVVNGEYAQYEMNSSNNAASRTFTVLPKDVVGPKIVTKYPEGTTKDREHLAVILEDQSEITNVELFLDGEKVDSSLIEFVQNRVWTKLEQPMTTGQHTVKVKAVDILGNASEEEWNFTVSPEIDVDKLKFKQEKYQLNVHHGRRFLEEIVAFDSNGTELPMESITNELTLAVDSSSSQDVIDVDENFVVYAIKEGEVNLKVSYGDTSATTTIEVSPVEEITYDFLFDKVNSHWVHAQFYGKRVEEDFYRYIGSDSSEPKSTENDKYKLSLSIEKEQYEQFNSQKALFTIGDTLYIPNLAEENSITLTKKNHSKIVFPENLDIQSVRLFPYVDGTNPVTDLEFTNLEKQEIFVPKGMYGLSILYKVDNKFYSYAIKRFEVTDNDYSVNIEDLSLASLELYVEEGLDFSNIHLNNWEERINFSIHEYEPGDPIYINPNVYDLSLGLQDTKFGYSLSADNKEIKGETEILISSEFGANIKMSSSPYHPGQNVRFITETEELSIQNEQGFNLDYLYTKETGEDIKGNLTFINTENEEERYEYEVDLGYPVVNIPNTSGKFDVIFTIKPLDDGTSPTEDEEGDEDGDTSEPNPPTDPDDSDDSNGSNEDDDSSSDGGTSNPNPTPEPEDEQLSLINLEENSDDEDVYFPDVKGHWAEDAINNMANNDVIKGFEDGTFRPNDFITRAEAMTIISNIITPIPEKLVELDFKDDIPPFAKDPVQIGLTLGLVSGYKDQTFRARNNITRAEIASLMNRLLNKVSYSNESTTSMEFKDSLPNWAKEDILTIAKYGIVVGYKDGEFKPNQPATRAEFTIMINKILEK